MSLDQLSFATLPLETQVQISSSFDLGSLLNMRRVSNAWRGVTGKLAEFNTSGLRHRFKWLVLKLVTLLAEYTRNPDLETQMVLARLFSAAVKTRMDQLKAIQESVKNDLDNGSANHLENAKDNYPRLLPLVNELLGLTAMLYNCNLRLQEKWVIRPHLTDFVLWHDYAQNPDRRDNSKIYFNYWYLTSGLFNYGASLSLCHANLCDVTFADQPENIEQLIPLIQEADSAYKIRFLTDTMFGKYEDYDSDNLAKLNLEHNLRYQQKLEVEKGQLQEEIEKFRQNASQTQDKKLQSVLRDTDPDEDENFSLRIENVRLKKEVEILRAQLYQELPRLHAALERHRGELSAVNYTNNLTEKIDALLCEIEGLREKLDLLKQKQKQEKSSEHKRKAQESAMQVKSEDELPAECPVAAKDKCARVERKSR
jgi:hypothetical protein